MAGYRIWTAARLKLLATLAAEGRTVAQAAALIADDQYQPTATATQQAAGAAAIPFRRGRGDAVGRPPFAPKSS